MIEEESPFEIVGTVVRFPEKEPVVAGKYSAIWDEVDNTPPNLIIHIKFKSLTDAEKFERTARTRKLQRKDRSYSDLTVLRTGRHVYVRGHAKEGLKDGTGNTGSASSEVEHEVQVS